MYFEMNDNRPYEIIHKETGRVIGSYANYAEAYKAYEKLGTGNEGMTDHAIGLVETTNQLRK